MQKRNVLAMEERDCAHDSVIAAALSLISSTNYLLIKMEKSKQPHCRFKDFEDYVLLWSLAQVRIEN